jgi:hypothetical protein
MKVPAQELIEGTLKSLKEEVSAHYFALMVRELVMVIIL